MSWFGPQDCNCCGELPPPDPCDCNQDLTYYFKIETTGFQHDHLVYISPTVCPGCPLDRRLHLSELNGTFFIPFLRNCSVSPVRFSLTGPRTIHTATIMSKYRRQSLGCSTTVFDDVGPAALALEGFVSGGTQFITISIGIPPMTPLPQQHSLFFDFPVPVCSDDPIIVNGSGTYTFENRLHGAGCGAFTDTLGSISWELVPGEAP